jgi:hypothetical protein
MPLAYLALSQIRAFLFRKLVLDKMALVRASRSSYASESLLRFQCQHDIRFKKKWRHNTSGIRERQDFFG